MFSKPQRHTQRSSALFPSIDSVSLDKLNTPQFARVVSEFCSEPPESSLAKLILESKISGRVFTTFSSEDLCALSQGDSDRMNKLESLFNIKSLKKQVRVSDLDPSTIDEYFLREEAFHHKTLQTPPPRLLDIFASGELQERFLEEWCFYQWGKDSSIEASSSSDSDLSYPNWTWDFPCEMEGSCSSGSSIASISGPPSPSSFKQSELEVASRADKNESEALPEWTDIPEDKTSLQPHASVDDESNAPLSDPNIEANDDEPPFLDPDTLPDPVFPGAYVCTPSPPLFNPTADSTDDVPDDLTNITAARKGQERALHSGESNVEALDSLGHHEAPLELSLESFPVESPDSGKDNVATGGDESVAQSPSNEPAAEEVFESSSPTFFDPRFIPLPPDGPEDFPQEYEDAGLLVDEPCLSADPADDGEDAFENLGSLLDSPIPSIPDLPSTLAPSLSPPRPEDTPLPESPRVEPTEISEDVPALELNSGPSPPDTLLNEQTSTDSAPPEQRHSSNPLSSEGTQAPSESCDSESSPQPAPHSKAVQSSVPGGSSLDRDLPPLPSADSEGVISEPLTDLRPEPVEGGGSVSDPPTPNDHPNPFSSEITQSTTTGAESRQDKVSGGASGPTPTPLNSVKDSLDLPENIPPTHTPPSSSPEATETTWTNDGSTEAGPPAATLDSTPSAPTSTSDDVIPNTSGTTDEVSNSSDLSDNATARENGIPIPSSPKPEPSQESSAGDGSRSLAADVPNSLSVHIGTTKISKEGTINGPIGGQDRSSELPSNEGEQTQVTTKSSENESLQKPTSEPVSKSKGSNALDASDGKGGALSGLEAPPTPSHEEVHQTSPPSSRDSLANEELRSSEAASMDVHGTPGSIENHAAPSPLPPAEPTVGPVGPNDQLSTPPPLGQGLTVEHQQAVGAGKEKHEQPEPGTKEALVDTRNLDVPSHEAGSDDAAPLPRASGQRKTVVGVITKAPGPDGLPRALFEKKDTVEQVSRPEEAAPIPSTLGAKSVASISEIAQANGEAQVSQDPHSANGSPSSPTPPLSNPSLGSHRPTSPSAIPKPVTDESERTQVSPMHEVSTTVTKKKEKELPAEGSIREKDVAPVDPPITMANTPATAPEFTPTPSTDSMPIQPPSSPSSPPTNSKEVTDESRKTQVPPTPKETTTMTEKEETSNATRSQLGENGGAEEEIERSAPVPPTDTTTTTPTPDPAPTHTASMVNASPTSLSPDPALDSHCPPTSSTLPREVTEKVVGKTRLSPVPEESTTVSEEEEEVSLTDKPQLEKSGSAEEGNEETAPDSTSTVPMADNTSHLDPESGIPPAVGATSPVETHEQEVQSSTHGKKLDEEASRESQLNIGNMTQAPIPFPSMESEDSLQEEQPRMQNGSDGKPGRRPYMSLIPLRSRPKAQSASQPRIRSSSTPVFQTISPTRFRPFGGKGDVHFEPLDEMVEKVLKACQADKSETEPSVSPSEPGITAENKDKKEDAGSDVDGDNTQQKPAQTEADLPKDAELSDPVTTPNPSHGTDGESSNPETEQGAMEHPAEGSSTETNGDKQAEHIKPDAGRDGATTPTDLHLDSDSAVLDNDRVDHAETSSQYSRSGMSTASEATARFDSLHTASDLGTQSTPCRPHIDLPLPSRPEVDTPISSARFSVPMRPFAPSIQISISSATDGTTSDGSMSVLFSAVPPASISSSIATSPASPSVAFGPLSRFYDPEDPRSELERLREENARLKAEVEQLRGHLSGSGMNFNIFCR